MFTDAGSELEKLILGENESLDNVRYDLNLITEIPGTGIQVAWETDNYDVIDIQGIWETIDCLTRGLRCG